MTLDQMRSDIATAITKGDTFTSRELAIRVYPRMFSPHYYMGKHPYSAQMTIVLKDFKNVVRDKKTKIYTVI